MKIGIDARLWNETGVGRYIRNLVNNLHQIDSKNEYVLFCMLNDASNIKSRVSSAKWKIVVSDIKWHSIKEQLKLPAVLKKESLDLMHFTYFSLPIFYSKPFIVTIHDLIINHFPTGKASTLPLPLYHLKRLAYKTVLIQSVKNAEKIIAPLNSTKDDLIKSLKIEPDKIIVTYEGVDEEFLGGKHKVLSKKSEHKTQNAKYFLYVGNAYPHKNLDMLIEAFLRSQSKAKLFLVGKEDYFYKKLSIKLRDKNYKNIEILHDIDDLGLQQLYKNALAVISPSVIEGFGLVPLEAMANSCLVLVSDIPSHKEVCKDSAIYFDPKNSRQLADLITEITYKNFEYRKIFIEKGAKRINDFSWKKMAEQTLKAYEQLAG